MQDQHADLLEDVGQQYVVLRPESLFQETAERARGRLGVKGTHDADEGLGVLGGDSTEVRSRQARVCRAWHMEVSFIRVRVGLAADSIDKVLE